MIVIVDYSILWWDSTHTCETDVDFVFSAIQTATQRSSSAARSELLFFQAAIQKACAENILPMSTRRFLCENSCSSSPVVPRVRLKDVNVGRDLLREFEDFPRAP
jgi:hypothetical protein